MSFAMVPDRNDKGHPEEWPVPGNVFGVKEDANVMNLTPWRR